MPEWELKGTNIQNDKYLLYIFPLNSLQTEVFYQFWPWDPSHEDSWLTYAMKGNSSKQHVQESSK